MNISTIPMTLEDGSNISDFSSDASKRFTDKNKYFLRFYLIDGSSFRVSYWLDDNVMTPGSFRQ